MWRYYELLSFRSSDEIVSLKREIGDGRNPRDVKVLLAQEIVQRFHSRQAAEDALADFEARFRQGAIPEDIEDVSISCDAEGMGIAQVMKQAGLTGSTSEAMRMIEQGGVRLDGERVSDRALILKQGSQVVLQVGKRKFARISLS